jgi:hypothetical protein
MFGNEPIADDHIYILWSVHFDTKEYIGLKNEHLLRQRPVSIRHFRTPSITSIPNCFGEVINQRNIPQRR